jgi:hypothetical protein
MVALRDSMLYTIHLKENMPMIYPNSWVADQIKEKHGVSKFYPHGEEDGLNIGIGFNNYVMIYVNCSFAMPI